MGIVHHGQGISSNRGPASLSPVIDHYVLEPEENTFRNLVVDLTHRCNMECANCYIPNRDIPDMDVDRLYDLLARLPKRTYIRLIGAEPTMRDDLPEIIRNIVKLGHKPRLVTNGLKLAQAGYCEALKKAGLHLVLISMNGADDDAAYRHLDNGRYATLKTRALTNIFKAGFPVNTGTIIARGLNEHVIKRQVETVVACAKVAGVDFAADRPWKRLPPMLRFKSVGDIGRHMAGRAYGFDELKELVSKELGDNPSDARRVASGLNITEGAEGDNRSLLLAHETDLGPVYIRLIDWSSDATGVVDAGNPNRGRVTRDFKIAPFFEDVKLNEFGY